MGWLLAALLLILLGALWYYDWWVQYKMRAWPTFPEFYEKAFHDIHEVLSEEQNDWWLTEGCLIWALRYGRNFPPELSDLVDDDIDVMIHFPDHQSWMQGSEQIAQKLRQKGWYGLNRRNTSFDKSKPQDKMQIKIRKGFLITRLDLHHYQIDEQRGSLFSTKGNNDYPFQYWNGYAPKELVYPLRQCTCYGMPVACPANPVELLSHWHDDDYNGAPLSYPLRPLNEKEKQIIDEYSIRLHQQGMVNWIDEEQSRQTSKPHQD